MSGPLCLLYDCDGTLVNSEPLLADEMAASLTALGLPFSREDYIGEFRGARFRNIVAELQKRHGRIDATSLKESEAAMRARLAERLVYELCRLPGVREALDVLKSYPRAVVSNGPEAKIRTCLGSTGLADYFGDKLFSAYTANCWKPDPGLYLHAAQAMGFKARDCLVIDDSIVGVRSALAGGFAVVHLNRFADVETTPQGAISITSMYQLPTVVSRLAHQEALAL
jgi:HAD superfamily hydrolase (TIGR01509 family)